jgi:mannose-6-phosphate isomerase
MNQLYPLKFNPIILDKMWGGSKLKNTLRKPTKSDKAGESWEISGVEGYVSVISNGFLTGNTLEELIEVYMGDLVGDSIYERFGLQFPLLIKFIDANDMLSIQVHPDDKLARERHNSYGKTEMWYILQADDQAELIVGFNRKISREIYLKHLNEKKLPAILNTEPVKPGDVFFLPAGRVHAIGAGILLAEIQQTSDITYRIYDFDRHDADGNFRELHTNEAVDAIDYTFYENYRTDYQEKTSQPVNLVKCNYFTTNKLNLASQYVKNTSEPDSFIIYICLEGKCIFKSEGNDDEMLISGECILVPAMLKQFSIIPETKSSLLEVYLEIPSDSNSLLI